MHRWETVGGWSGAANKAFLGQMVEGWRGGGGVVGMVKLLNWTAAGFYFLSRPPSFFFLFFSSAITSIMAIQRAKQAILQWTVWGSFLIRYEINYSRHLLKTFKFG